jgi:hypothetical protein
LIPLPTRRIPRPRLRTHLRPPLPLEKARVRDPRFARPSVPFLRQDFSEELFVLFVPYDFLVGCEKGPEAGGEGGWEERSGGGWRRWGRWFGKVGRRVGEDEYAGSELRYVYGRFEGNRICQGKVQSVSEQVERIGKKTEERKERRKGKERKVDEREGRKRY